MIELLKNSFSTSRAISRQISIALANLAIQLLDWKGVLEEMVSTFGNSNQSLPSLLEFLKVLPEELNDRRHINISDEEYHKRSEELIESNANKVVELLLNYIQKPESTANRALVLECFNSWLPEVSLREIVSTSLLDIVFACLDDVDTFEAAVDSVVQIIKDTRETDESLPVIQLLFPRIINLRHKIAECKDDPDAYQGYTRLFAEAGECWHVLIASSPREFRPLVEAIAECTAFDEDLEVVQYTFYFWYSLKQMLVMDHYQEARQLLGDIYLKLISVIIKHLHYPKGGSSQDNIDDLFHGNREEEDKFRSFRHEIGNVLKDCCAVVGSSRGLEEAFGILKAALSSSASTWQDVEAPLFSMRSMSREIGTSENLVLPQIMDALLQIPEHDKIRYATTLVLGCYTEWTAVHPEFLDRQLNYIISGFNTGSQDVKRAAAQALMHFCEDCRDLLVPYVEQLHVFYEKVSAELDRESLLEVTDGIAHVVLAQPSDKILSCFQPFCTPVVQRLYQKANMTSGDLVNSDAFISSIADDLEVFSIFVQVVRPVAMNPNPISPFIIEIYPMIDLVLKNHGKNPIIAEKGSKLIKQAMRSCGMGISPILGAIAETLANEFNKNPYGCYLWVSGAVLREFGDESINEGITIDIKQSVWTFAYQQITSFFRYLSGLPDARNISDPNIVDDFFRMIEDILIFFPVELLSSDLLYPTYQAGLIALSLTEYDPIISALHFFKDLFGYALDKPSNSKEPNNGPAAEAGKKLVFDLVNEKQGGEELLGRLVQGLIYTFPKDCITTASSVFPSLMQVAPRASGLFESWLSKALDNLPQDSIGEVERRKLIERVSSCLKSGDYRRAQTAVRDFCNVCARRNVRPRLPGSRKFTF